MDTSSYSRRAQARLICLCSILMCLVSSSVPITVVNLQTLPANSPLLLSVTAAAGFLNRLSATVYTVRNEYDEFWLQALMSNATFNNVDPTTFVNATLHGYAAIIYDDTDLATIPSVVTISASSNAVPIGASVQHLFPNATVSLNTVGLWATPEDAVSYAASCCLEGTTSLAFQDPQLLSQGLLADFMIARRLFVQYLNDSCIPGTTDHDILGNILDQANWTRPVRVYGYNAMDVVFGGDLYEAETDCFDTMGQIATANSNNLAFWQHVQRFVPNAAPGSTYGPMIQPPAEKVIYDANTTYVALVYGDMDNIDFVQTFGRQHMQQRVQYCAQQTTPCFPLTWTLSPNLIDFAPAMLRWYYTQAASTRGSDWFIMPPSGTLYAYPGQMPPAAQEAFVQQQTAQAVTMGTHGSVHWEWIFTWDNAFDNYFPRYVGATNSTRSFFLNNVPWVLPILDLWNETYRIIGDASDPQQCVVTFKPAFNWQAQTGGGGLSFNATIIADIINDLLPPGTVTYVYVIQNTDFSELAQMTQLLAPHVQLVSYGALTDLALQREAATTKRK